MRNRPSAATPVQNPIATTKIERFVRIGSFEIALIKRFNAELAYGGNWDELSSTWATAPVSEPGTFHEHGALSEALTRAGERSTVVGAAIACPWRFAEMVATNETAGRVLYPDCISSAVVARFVRVEEFDQIEVDKDQLVFHTYVPPRLDGGPEREAGVYRLRFSFADYSIDGSQLAVAAPAGC